ncbi:protein kinase C delta type-like [Mixophyes fleayi]|uniref:protein kinase C delta type-like n=1 Tax=Mixophyes fleayi TaxID=3061075 RepID=UPI003F4DEC73
MLATCSTGTLVAVKVVRKTISRRNSLIKECAVLELARECRFLAGGLSYFQTQTHCFMVMEYASGGMLLDLMRKHSIMEDHAAAFYSAEIICGIQYLHSRGIVHRDLKPANVLIDNYGHVKIADFGLVAMNIFGTSTTCGWTGTITYMAPEIIMKQRYAAGVDFWALGVMLHYMLTGKMPSKGIIKTALSSDNVDTKRLEEAPADILRQLLNRNPAQRLGVNGDIRGHPFYQHLNWADLERGRITPPYQQDLKAPLSIKVPERPFSILSKKTTSQAEHISISGIPYYELPGGTGYIQSISL